jgi:hypothetical protein
MSVPSIVRSRRPPLSADGRGRGLPAVSPTRRCRRSKRVAEIAENAGIDGNEVLECSRVIDKSLAEIADIPCKYFARETVRGLTATLWGAVQTPVRNSIPNLRQMCPRRSRVTGEASDLCPLFERLRSKRREGDAAIHTMQDDGWRIARYACTFRQFAWGD